MGGPRGAAGRAGHGLIDWRAFDTELAQVYAATKGEPAWPPLALFKALLLAVWYDPSGLKLTEALDDRASFRPSRGFARHEPTPEQTAFVRFRKELVGRGLDEAPLATISRQLEVAGVVVKPGTLVAATVIAAASRRDGEAAWAEHRRRAAVHG